MGRDHYSLGFYNSPLSPAVKFFWNQFFKTPRSSAEVLALQCPNLVQGKFVEHCQTRLSDSSEARLSKNVLLNFSRFKMLFPHCPSSIYTTVGAGRNSESNLRVEKRRPDRITSRGNLPSVGEPTGKQSTFFHISSPIWILEGFEYN